MQRPYQRRWTRSTPSTSVLAAELELLSRRQAAVGDVGDLDLELALLGELRGALLGELHLDGDLAGAAMSGRRLDQLRLLLFLLGGRGELGGGVGGLARALSADGTGDLPALELGLEGIRRDAENLGAIEYIRIDVSAGHQHPAVRQFDGPRLLALVDEVPDARRAEGVCRRVEDLRARRVVSAVVAT